MEDAVFRVTAIERQVRNPSRVNVYLDGAFAFGLDDEVLFRHPIHEGDEVSESFVDEVLLSDERVRAKTKALRLLSHRALTTGELSGRLRDKEFSDRTVRRVVADLVGAGLLNDTSYAASFVHDRMLQRPCAKHLIVLELIHKGIPEEDAGRIVEESYGPRGEEDVAGTLFRKKMQLHAEEDPRKARKKAVEFLLRRGFEWEVIRSVMLGTGGEAEGEQRE